MEKRLIVAIVLSFLVLMGYQYFFVKPNKPVEAPVVTQTAPLPGTAGSALETKKETPAEAKPAPAEPVPAPDTAAVAGKAEQEVVVDTPLYRAVWANKGGVLKSWKLKLYKDRVKKGKSEPKELELVRGAVEADKDSAGAAESQLPGPLPFSLDLDDKALADLLNGKLFEVTLNSELAEGDRTLQLQNGSSGKLSFKFKDGSSVTAIKTFTFTGGRYDVETDIQVLKNNQVVSSSILWGPGIGNPSTADLKQSRTANRGIATCASSDRPKVIRVSEKNLKSGQAEYNGLRWAAYEDHYFVALFVLPSQNGRAIFRQELAAAGQTPGYFLSVIQPKRAYIGPKESETLKAFGDNAKDVIQFGSFLGLNLKVIAEIMLVAVKFFHRIIPNWGLAIILLTFVIKIIFFPLTYSSTKSMVKMADLQPKVKAIRAKYKKAKSDIAQRRLMNEEMMKLYKEHGVNPAGGCLPMLIQLPVFIGIYQMLMAAVEFRHSPFVFWIKDLSVYDPTFVTPVLMGITQFVSQKVAPTSADPSQAKMMLIMPILMTFFFLYFQSGLVLYWLTTNVLQIGQQALMNRMMHRHKRDDNGKRK